MGLKIGIVGLPNVGKSSTFNVLTKAQNAQSANYPFCTIEPNKASVPLPDPRLKELAKLAKPQNTVPSIVDFVDIAGLVRGASKGEGLGNKFLSHIREVDVILHLVRAFESDDITHVEGSVDALRDIEIIDLELIISDLASLERRIEKLSRQIKSDKGVAKLLECALDLRAFLESGKSAREFPSSDEFKELDSELKLLSNKPVLFVANVDENFDEHSKQVLKIQEHAKSQNTEAIEFCAKIEEELIGMDDDEKNNFLLDLGFTKGSGLERIIQSGFKKLGLITYFTVGEKEVRSWTINDGDKAPKAAGVIHNDFEKGFIRAQVISYEDFIKAGSEQAAKASGLLRVEGKDYIVRDGDVMHFLFNV